MSDPTLDTTAPYTGMTVNQMLEAVLRRRGLTLDSDTTGRVLASATEIDDIELYFKRAHTRFNAEYQESFALERASGTWTSGDTALMLPAGCGAVLSLYINGVLCHPIEMEDLRRTTIVDTDVSTSMGFTRSADNDELYYRISGIADADAVANGGAGAGPVDYRPVVQIYGESEDGIDAVPYVIDYVRFGAVFTEAGIPRAHPIVQDWLISKAAEMWATEENDEVTKTIAMTEQIDLMQAVWAIFDSRGDTAERARWTYPRLAKQTRRTDVRNRS